MGPPSSACRRSTGLISIDASGPTSADVPPDARLGDPAHLQALHVPEPRLDLVPLYVLQRDKALLWPERLRGLVGFCGGAILVNVALGLGFFFLLSFRDVETPREIEIPVEVVQDTPKTAAVAEGPKGSGAAGGGGQSASGPGSNPMAAPGGQRPAPPPPQPRLPPPDAGRADALSRPASPPPAPPAASKDTAEPSPPPAPPTPPSGGTAPPKLIAPPPEAARSATQDKENKPANLVPDEHQADQATREAKPAVVPDVLATPDAKAAASVPAPAKAPTAPLDKPTPPTSAKTPSAADKLAAALPMDSSALPMSFRSVLAGNATAQINAAYAGVVQGRIRQAQAELARTAFAQRLTGNVAVAFTIDDAGKLVSLTVAQSSGRPELDALALQAIQSAAPFPPPPPEADHTFKKAFLVGG